MALINYFESINKLIIESTKNALETFVYKGGALIKGQLTHVEAKITSYKISKKNEVTVKFTKGISNNTVIKLKTSDLLDLKPKLLSYILRNWYKSISESPETLQKCIENAKENGVTIVPISKVPSKIIDQSVDYMYRYVISDIIFAHSKDFSLNYEVFYKVKSTVEGYSDHLLSIEFKI